MDKGHAIPLTVIAGVLREPFWSILLIVLLASANLIHPHRGLGGQRRSCIFNGAMIACMAIPIRTSYLSLHCLLISTRVAELSRFAIISLRTRRQNKARWPCNR